MSGQHYRPNNVSAPRPGSAIICSITVEACLMSTLFLSNLPLITITVMMIKVRLLPGFSLSSVGISLTRLTTEEEET